MARLATARPVALVVAAVCVAGLVLAGLGLKHVRLGFPLIRALPAASQEVRAEAAAAKGFVPGILSPTEVLVLGPGVADQRAALGRLQRGAGAAARGRRASWARQASPRSSAAWCGAACT